MGFIKEFKEFAVKGNVMDMAVGVIIGGAFGKIVTSLVGDVLMPDAGRGSGGWCFGICLRTVRTERHRLHHHRLLYLHDAQGYQQAQPQEGRARSRARGSRRTYPGRVAR